ncbi:MAG: hypothetical protein CVT80_00035 [Alphaproteobacteria bacterium HGW-Alphaproteobacteria-2]|nr:MAG: hypothetical protein CVT80_00035 [Alphaproteobacteria bacterium HGW-Alphaproteobacteria-2]
MLKPALRRAAHILAPAARSDLVRFVADPLAPFGDQREAVNSALEEMIVYGDILAMRRQPLDDWGAPAEVLRPAPPTFVRRSNGEFIILGVAGDHPNMLSDELEKLVVEVGMVRRLPPDGGDLAAHLRLLGLAQLSEQAWLRTPQAETATAHRARWRTQLNMAPSLDHAVDGLEILDGSRDPRYYRGRWTAVAGQSGMFVARRPQLYGASLWSLVHLERGQARRLIDLYADDNRQRPCDLAWRLQAALDAERAAPQRVRIRRTGATASLDLFSPLPAFSERRLALVATKAAGVHCLYSFTLPTTRLAEEIGALQSLLWMAVDEEDA